jgi:hypothetical protein
MDALQKIWIMKILTSQELQGMTVTERTKYLLKLAEYWEYIKTLNRKDITNRKGLTYKK